MTPDFAAQLAALEQALAAARPEDAPALIGELERLKARLWVRMTSAAAENGRPEVAPADSDRWLTVEEAGAITNLPARWFYRHKALPFVKQLSRRCLRVNETGLRRWLASRRT